MNRIDKTKSVLKENAEKRKKPQKTPAQKEQDVKDSLERGAKIKWVRGEIHKLKMHMDSSVRQLERLVDEEAALRDDKEKFSVSYAAYLKQCHIDSQEEAISNERAIAILKERSKMCPLDRAMSAKTGFGSSRPVFQVKGDK